MGKHLRVIFLTVCFLLGITGAWSQVRQYKFTRLDLGNDGTDKQISCVYKDAKGFTWFGTNVGLCRCDGYRLLHYKHNALDSNSIGENHVVHIYEGPDAKIWIITHSGISIYDPLTEHFSTRVSAELRRLGMPDVPIRLVRKCQNIFWFVTVSNGIYRLDVKQRKVTRYAEKGEPGNLIHSNQASDISETADGQVWVVYCDGILEHLGNTEKPGEQFSFLSKAHPNLREYWMFTDSRSQVWIYSDRGSIGAYCFKPVDQTAIHFSKEEKEHSISSNLVNSIVESEDREVWLGTDHGGINVVEPPANRITRVLSNLNDAGTLGENSVNLYKDADGIIWVGTFKHGVRYYHSGIVQFPIFNNMANQQASLPFDDINCFAEDATGTLWIGTNGGGLLSLDRSRKIFTRFRHNAHDPGSLSNDVVLRAFIDHNKNLWLGTYFGGLERFDGKRFTHYRHDPKDPHSIADDRVFAIHDDAHGNLLVGLFNGGLETLDIKRGIFKHGTGGLKPNYISCVYRDHADNTWVGRDNGLDLIYKDGRLRHFESVAGSLDALVANDVNTVVEDSRGLIWIGTREGLSILDVSTNRFLSIPGEINWPRDEITNIIEDNQNQVWISASNGILKIVVAGKSGAWRFKVNAFNELDGLQGNVFNLDAAIKLKNGNLIFGGAKGFNLFDPRVVHNVSHRQNLIFTDFQVFNKPVVPGQIMNGRAILDRAISETNAIVLHHNENVFNIDFSACDYFNPEKIKYEYRLEGFDKTWVPSLPNERRATYTNLDAGDYLLRVRAKNTNTGQVSEARMNITVLPPFWKHPFAWFLYLLVLGGLLLYARHRGILKLKKAFHAEQTRQEHERSLAEERAAASHLHQMDLMKIKFFSNISHDLRTPLTLVLSPVDDLLEHSEKFEQQQRLLMIKRNGRRLLHLVNQMSDFKRLETNELGVCLGKGDIIQFVREVSLSFTDVAHQKKIQYQFDCDVKSYITAFDHDKIERILFNLLSNAFKFTAPGGTIGVSLQLNGHLLSNGQKTLELNIADTGTGILPELKEKIFERFFQDELSQELVNQGSGIGLSITREFVQLLGGTVCVDSTPQVGSCFTVSIPVGNEIGLPVAKTDDEEADPALKLAFEPKTTGRTTILVAEDNDELRSYLRACLSPFFQVLESSNGKDAWQKALALHPDLILSDVDMPGLTGLELCKKIRADKRTSHIPLIFLTGLTSEQQQLEGLRSGGNDYLVKPFNADILLSKIKNLLQSRRQLSEQVKNKIDIEPREVAVVSEDEKFLKKVYQVIEEQIPNPAFSVEFLSRELAVSRVSLYRKVLILTGKTPVDLIRFLRLERSRKLLEKSQMSIASVAYEVGFNSAAYYAKVFREEFGVLPSEHLNGHKNK